MSSYLLPPVNADAVNATTARFGISESMFVSSSVPEQPPAVYSSGTTYALGARSSTGTAGQVITVWESLQAGNVGHTPSSSPTWWKNVGTTYSEWASGSWETGDRVIRSGVGLHYVYQRLTPGGSDSDTPESAPTKWARVGTTNRWAMFDMLSSTPTTAVSPLTVVIQPGRISGLALLDADGGYAHMALNSTADGLVFDETESLDSTVIGSWEDYFFAPFTPRNMLARRDIPSYSDGTLTITITSDSGSVSLGKLVVGVVQRIGNLLSSPKVREKSFTTVTRDQFGTLTDINVQRVIPQVSGSLLTEKSDVLNARVALRSARRCPCVFIGLDNDEDAYADLLTFLALCTDYDIDPRHPTHAVLNTELEGV